MFKPRLLVLSSALALSAITLAAQNTRPDATLTIAISGKLDPKISGKDPASAAGKAGKITIKASETLSPSAHTATTATYTIPAGSITAVVAGHTTKNTSPAKLKFSVPAKGSDTITVSGSFSISGVTANIVGTLQLAHGSFTSAVLKHPTAFKPLSQKLVAATTKTGPGSKVSYTVISETTLLGISGTAKD